MTRPAGSRPAALIVGIVQLSVLLALAGGAVWFFTSLDNPKRQVATTISDFRDLCAGRPIPGAAAYVPGSGTHPVAAFGSSQDEMGGIGNPVTFDSGADRAVYVPSDVSTVQLVACAERVEDGPVDGSCAFQGATAPLHRATVEITVYEARTGERVGEPATVVAGDTRCPFIISYKGSPVVYTTPTPGQFQAVLAPLVGV